VVKVDRLRHFVVADIPGVIEGAADGAGLGIRFLKHLSRTRLLLHLVDIAPLDGHDPAEDVRQIETEIRRWSGELAAKPRWLVLNKIDLLPPDELEDRWRALVETLRWQGPVFAVSALSGAGTRELVQAVMNFLGETDAQPAGVAAGP